ncbi:hypothetical protein BB561_005614 [Smittium simulii]|uniref:RRM domain-containing protein n=1 Tax=Smittium simulii TaxID=133385 RepID=A0A2T9Y9I1_9FUNG|nr:hypothetical protein BB561_005614 [Smittium simulii]
MSSRIIVKNLPKRYSEDRFKAHFSQKGVVTDARIMLTLSGDSRRFGFVGFQNEKEAKAAVKYFNGTFIDTSKIIVELAKPTGDSALPRPWSSYTKARNMEEHQKKIILGGLNQEVNDTGSNSHGADNKNQSTNNKTEKDASSVLQTLYEETVAKSASDPRFQEFLQVMAPRAKSKTWANDDINTFSNKEKDVLAKIISQKKKMSENLDQTSDKDKLEGMNLKKKASSVKATVQEVVNKKPGGASLTVSKTHITFDQSDDSDNENDGESSLDDNSEELINENDFDVNFGSEKPENSLSFTALSADIEWLKKHIKGPELKSNDSKISENNTKDDTINNSNNSEKTKSNSSNLDSNLDNTPAKKSIRENLLEELSAKQKESEEIAKKIQDSGRLFVRNLPYGASENELRKYFEKYGPLSELHIPIDKESKRSKGFAYVLFVLPEHAVKAFKSSDHQFFQGRLLHILAAEDKPNYKQTNIEGFENSSTSIKNQKAQKAKANAGSSFNWNSLYMSADAVADSISERLQISKSDLLSSESGSPAVRLALAETHIISETKTFLERNGLYLDAFADKKATKSDHVILVKNIPFSVSKFKTNSEIAKESEHNDQNSRNDSSSTKSVEEEITRLFGVHGTLGRVLVPPAKTIAIIEFIEAQEARAAFKHLAYKRFGDAPLYLEWAPDKIFKTKFDQTKHANLTQKSISNDEPDQSYLAKKAPLGASDVLENLTQPDNKDDDVSMIDTNDNSNDGQPGKIIFIKNLNFKTTEETLKNAIMGTEGLRSVVIKTRLRKDKEGKMEKLSMGFGFAEYSHADVARLAIQSLQGIEVDGHVLQVKLSDRTSISSSETNKKESISKSGIAIETNKSNKLVVKNIPFEATKSDIRELFGAYAQLKSVRLPSKFSGGHRGFAFLEFLTSQEAQNCLDNVGAGSHLYGRRLVVNWADDEPGLDGKLEDDENDSNSLEKLSGLEKLREKSTRKFRPSARNNSETNGSNKKIKM